MNKEDLDEYKKKLANLSEEDKKERNLYLKGLADGTLQGPQVGKSSIDKPWLKKFENDELLKEVPKMSVYQLLKNKTKEYDNLYAFGYFNVKITFKEFKEKVEETKKALLSLGVKTGDVVSVCLPNIPEVGYIFYALNDLGVCVNLLDPRTNSSTLCRSVDDAKSNLLISLDSVVPSFLDCHANNIVSISALNSLPKLFRSIVPVLDKTMRVKLPKDNRIIKYSEFMNGAKKYNNVKIESSYNPGAPAVIAYTGGTTGIPKGVIMTNESLNAMTIENECVHYNAAAGDSALGMAPPWTFYGLNNCLNAYLGMGICIQMIPKFGPDDLGQLVDKYKPNHVITVPSALVGMINEEKLKNTDLSFLKTVIVGADKLSEKLENEFDKFLLEHNSNIKVSKGYGMTEVGAATSYAMKDTNEPGTVGVPLVLENIATFNPENPDEELNTGEVGELCISGPKNMVGYFGENSNKTADVLNTHSDGTVWAHTGDLGYVDKDGKIYIVGRKKRMFVKAGFKIFPGEIETQILKHPDVEQAAVVAVENESMGFVISGYITLKQTCQKGYDEVISEINEILAANMYDYELPDSIKIIEHMPLTGMNKIDFKALEIKAKAEMDNNNIRKI